MATTRTPESTLDALEAVQARVLWLATSIIHHANRVRHTGSGVKVGGHQASSASMVSIMTALWFDYLRPQDRVSVKPHASPVLHAIEYLLGTLETRYLTTLREMGGLQSYPSRLKDPVIRVTTRRCSRSSSGSGSLRRWEPTRRTRGLDRSPERRPNSCARLRHTG